VKDPSTARRVSRLNPERAWIIKDVPELRIVDDDLWQAVKARQGDIAMQYANLIEAVRGVQPAQRLSAGKSPVLRTDLLRLLRRPLCPSRPGPLRVFGPRHQWLVLQQSRHSQARP